MRNGKRPAKINGKKANKIIQNRLPLGLFYLREGRRYVGIDNNTGDAWTEDFRTRGACLRWLRNPELTV